MGNPLVKKILKFYNLISYRTYFIMNGHFQNRKIQNAYFQSLPGKITRDEARRAAKKVIEERIDRQKTYVPDRLVYESGEFIDEETQKVIMRFTSDFLDENSYEAEKIAKQILKSNELIEKVRKVFNDGLESSKAKENLEELNCLVFELNDILE